MHVGLQLIYFLRKVYKFCSHNIPMFLKKITTRGRAYYYLVESYRSDGKVRHRVVRYLGTAENLFMMLENKTSVVMKRRSTNRRSVPVIGRRMKPTETY